MYKNIFDSHAHYDDEQFDLDRNELLVSFEENGISGVVCCGILFNFNFSFMNDFFSIININNVEC